MKIQRNSTDNSLKIELVYLSVWKLLPVSSSARLHSSVLVEGLAGNKHFAESFENCSPSVIGLLSLLNEHKALWHRLLLEVIRRMRLPEAGLPRAAVKILVERSFSSCFSVRVYFKKMMHKCAAHPSSNMMNVSVTNTSTISSAKFEIGASHLHDWLAVGHGSGW